MKPATLTLSAVLLGLGLGSVAACAEEEPPFELTHETEHMRIGVADGQPLCGGDLAYLEQHVVRVEDLLSTQMEGKVDVYLWRGASVGWNDYCSADQAGCYRRDTHTIYTSQDAVGHELVHAVAIPLGKPSAMWSEGIAEALDQHRTVLGATPLLENFFRDDDVVDYASAGHFVRWAWEVYGAQAVRELLSDPRDPEVAFEAITGQTLAEAQAEYAAQAPWSFAVLETCQFGALTETTPGEWADDLELDCDNDQTLWGSSELGMRRSFEVTSQGGFRVTSDADRLFIQRCPDEDILARPEEEPGPEQGDVPISTPSVPEGPGVLIDGQGAGQILELAPARYELIIASNEARVVSVAVRSETLP
ncbi:hypothetical protein PPSIR1_06116 [Plesiocystis pacifica SIR-1]|uniref:Lipoprotein n=1 Tax=Plesiocystis pacifica SIR-1 TaxID=391625 RepID=A6G6U8_9BACT|nr:hypothetical protein [Plesiocystis pacifica]EDM78401.1 hypothetical protein PPSIR1_06116 [Plesiocystis pacifica SIR-1]